MVLFDILANNQASGKTAIIHNGEDISYRELYERSLLLGNTLRLKSFKNKNIGIYINNSINYVIAYFAITYIGAVIVPLDVEAPVEQLKVCIEANDLCVILTDRLHYNNSLRTLNTWEVTVVDISQVFDLHNCANHIIPPMLPPIFQYDCDSTAIMIQTSGTTSLPKMVMLSHRSIILNAQLIIREFNICDEDVTLFLLPIRLSCNTSQFITHLLSGASIVFATRLFSAKYILESICRYRITNVSVVPPMLYLLHKYIGDSGVVGCESLRFVCYSGCPMNYDVVRSLQRCFPHTNFAEAYGMTEAGPRISIIHNREKEVHPDSVGKPMKTISIKVIDEVGSQVPYLQLGEICVKSDSIMKGYYNSIVETQQIIGDGWLRTGDMGYVDEQGYIYLVGRRKNLINYGGNKVSPEEVEAAIMQLSYVSAVYVYAKKHPVLNEIVVADVVLEENRADVKQNIYQHCLSCIEKYKMPKEINIVQSIPATPSGKIKRCKNDTYSSY